MQRSIRLTQAPSLDDLGIERVPWESGLGDEFISTWGRPGGRYDPEHLTVYGKSGGGKTHFTRRVVVMRAEARGSHVVVVVTKKSDREIDKFHTENGWKITDTWPPGHGENQVVYWARAKGLSAEHRIPQRAKVKKLMDALWVKDSNIIVVWDELSYVTDMLRLKSELETFYREGRGNGITNVALMQRPSGVTRLSHSEAGWTAAFPPKDADDRKRVAEVLGDRQRFSYALGQLDRTKHEFLLRHDRSGMTYVTHLPPPRVANRAGSRNGGQRVRSPH
jgi:hypothetical protein